LYVQRYSGPRRQMHLTDHPFTELLYVFAGEGALRGPSPLPLRAGTAVLIPPRYPHLEHAVSTIDTLWIGLSGSAVPKHGGPRHTLSVELGPVMEAIWLLGQWRYGQCGPELDGLCRQALGRFERLSLEEAAASGEAELIHRATTYLRRHHAKPITVSILAAELGVSEGHLHRRFRALTGRTPIDYLIDLRLASAMEMMRHSAMSIRKIARLTGFGDPLYFSRVCRKRTGHPPSHWRPASNARAVE
jgi:AraC-like DNA-binding protein